MSTNKNELNVLTAADMTAAQLELEADAVIIGSGAGGGINAYELAKAGKKVIVLEAGPYVPSEKFTEMMAVSMATMYEGEGAQSNTDGDITVLQGRCVGGSTVVNAALCFRTPDYYLKKWAKEYKNSCPNCNSKFNVITCKGEETKISDRNTSDIICIHCHELCIPP